MVWPLKIIITQFVFGMICCGVIFGIWRVTSGRGIKWW